MLSVSAPALQFTTAPERAPNRRCPLLDALHCPSIPTALNRLCRSLKEPLDLAQPTSSLLCCQQRRCRRQQHSCEGRALGAPVEARAGGEPAGGGPVY